MVRPCHVRPRANVCADHGTSVPFALRHSPGCAENCDRCTLSRYEILPYLGAATGARQGEMFAIDSERDIDFLRRVIHIRRQVKIIRGKQVFASPKNDKVHDVLLMTPSVSVRR
jgi:hypothetical protein